MRSHSMQANLLRPNGLQKRLSNQSGLSLTGWFLALFLTVFFVQLVIKLSPVYLEDYYVQSSLKSLSKNAQLTELSPADIRKKLSKSFSINNISSGALEALQVKRDAKKVLVDINYEERIPFMANIDIVLSFEHHLDSSNIDKCCDP
ncbi:MAG: hypothetical protein ACI9D5_001431 [Candidatus Endobugula sp.]|jgi:hypothetical protein